MKTFIKYELRNVYIDGALIKNAKIVNHVRSGNKAIENEIEVSEKNKGLAIVGMAYDSENDEFVNIDVEPELTQLDIIEANTSYLVMISE